MAEELERMLAEPGSGNVLNVIAHNSYKEGFSKFKEAVQRLMKSEAEKPV